MSAPLLALLVSALKLLVLCGPPVLALRMILSRLRHGRVEARWIYLLLGLGAAVMLAFNLMVLFGVTGPIAALLPEVVSTNTGTAALLSAWIAAGLCLCLAVVAPRRRRGTSHI